MVWTLDLDMYIVQQVKIPLFAHTILYTTSNNWECIIYALFSIVHILAQSKIQLKLG
jgi:hypothetical protein